jgi:hypothetical protein
MVGLGGLERPSVGGPTDTLSQRPHAMSRRQAPLPSSS